MQGPSKFRFAWTLFLAFFPCFSHVLQFGSKRSKQITDSFGNLKTGKCKFLKGSRNAVFLGPLGPTWTLADVAAGAVEEGKGNRKQRLITQIYL
jgi:hypothetical protein